MTRGLGAVVVCAVGLAACFVHTRSDELQCKSSMDCTPPRVCLANYCVLAGGQVTCPSQCSSCANLDAMTPTCTYNGTGGASFSCPQGFQCNIDCQSPGACGSVTCSGSAACTVTCDSVNACGSVTCGTGSCSVTCTGTHACGSISCPEACACDVSCSSGNACGNETCPSPQGNACSAGGNCSSAANGCNSC